MKKLLSLTSILLLCLLLLFGYKDIPVDRLKEKYATFESQFLDLADMSVHFRDQGDPADSLPIVLIHGTGASLHTFEGWTGKLKVSHRVISLDLPGYGLTGPFSSRDYSIVNYTKFLKSFLDELQIQKCILAGNSLGGRIAWSFTETYPNQVEKLILIDAAGYPLQSTSKPIAFKMAETPVVKHILKFITPKFIARKSVENVYADKSKVNEALVDRYFELTLREGNRQAFVDRFAAENPKDDHLRIKNIHQPTLILWGEKDDLIPLEAAYRFQEDLPNDTLVILSELGHVPMEEDPAGSLESVLSFIEK